MIRFYSTAEGRSATVQRDAPHLSSPEPLPQPAHRPQKKRMTAEVGPAHQRAREFLARAAGDETYGKLAENFDAARRDGLYKGTDKDL